jgi:hypothetical protein
MSEGDEVYVWQAPRPLRLFSYIALAVVLLLALRVVVAFGYLAIIGVVLVLGAASQVWWMILRPRLQAGPDGVDVVVRREPDHVDWADIRRVEPGPDGLKIFCTGGREVVSRFPQQTRPKPGEPPESEADRVAAFLAQRAAWTRRPGDGPPPRYQPGPA